VGNGGYGCFEELFPSKIWGAKGDFTRPDGTVWESDDGYQLEGKESPAHQDKGGTQGGAID